jgi:hypothetical protein
LHSKILRHPLANNTNNIVAHITSLLAFLHCTTGRGHHANN